MARLVVFRAMQGARGRAALAAAVCALAFLPRPDGTLVHTLDVLPDRTGVNFRDHALVGQSLRAQVCAQTPLWRAGT